MHVFLTVAASIIRAPEDTMVTAYSNTSLNCQSFGEGTNITWSFNGRPLVLNEMTLIQESYDPDTSITSSYLTLISPSLEEAGVYHCTVSNGVPITSPRTLHTANASLLILPSKYTHTHARTHTHTHTHTHTTHTHTHYYMRMHDIPTPYKQTTHACQ